MLCNAEAGRRAGWGAHGREQRGGMGGGRHLSCATVCCSQSVGRPQLLCCTSCCNSCFPGGRERPAVAAQLQLRLPRFDRWQEG